MNQIDDKRIAEELGEATRVLADNRFPTSEDCVLELLSRGYSRARAEKLYFFLETAFGRITVERLANVVFAETYIVESADGVHTEFNFANDPDYQHAVHIASGLVANNVRDIALPIAVRSAELSAFSHAIESGENLNGSVFSPPRWNSALPASAWESFSQ